jgi:hypothetical protein
MDFLQKYVRGVFFELPLPRNAQKRTKKNVKKQIFGVGCWLVPRNPIKYTSRSVVPPFFLRAPWAPCPRGAEEEKKKSDVPTYLPFLSLFAIFRSDFRKYFYGVFGSLMQRNGQKRDKKKSMGKDDRKKVLFSQLFRPKVFDMDFPQKVFYGVFELPLLRNAQKRHGKRSKEKSFFFSLFSAKSF